MDIEPGISPDYLPMDPKRLLERLHTALNTRDLTNLVHMLQVDYEFVEPAQPGGGTVGIEAARQRWDQLFQAYPDFRADLIRQAVEGNTIWSEWHWKGSGNGNTSRLDRAGVLIFGVEEGLIAWTRSYMIDAAD